jgi:hypothetical protein
MKTIDNKEKNMEAWSPITIAKVADDTGDLTALFPPSCTAESGTTQGSLRRRQTQGTLYRVEVFTSDAAGGIIEIWDLDGLSEGATNNISTGAALTNAFKTAKATLGQARMIWTQNFKGDAASRAAIFTGHVPFSRGLCARYINAAGTSVKISIVADGGYVKTTICG